MRQTTAILLTLLAAAGVIASPAPAKSKRDWVVRPEWVEAHERFLAGDELRGRGSATADEAIAAAYVAAQFRQFGLVPAPGMRGYLQTARVVRTRLTRPPVLRAGEMPVGGLTLFFASAQPISGTIAVMASDNPSDMPTADIVVATSAKASPFALFGAAQAKKVKLLIVRESEATRAQYRAIGGTRLPLGLEGAEAPPPRTTFATLPDTGVDALAKAAGAPASLDFPGVERVTDITTNAIGYLPGSDPAAGVLLFSAHLDHLGVLADGTVMHGANDDASGTVAVLEIARAMAAGKRPRRSLMFVAYGSEEIGLFGSAFFGAHPPVPLTDIIANLEFEMIGTQDPKLPKGVMMMTGYDRSDFGAALKAHGALVTADPYPEQRFFQRSDNYSLAKQGIVAHTVSGWALVPTYHKPSDTVENIDFAFMTGAIQSLIAPIRWMAGGDFRPTWAKGGKPAP